MWLSRALAVLFLAAGLTACGFRPLYGEGAVGARQGLQSIDIALIEGRLGQLLRFDLQDRLISGDGAADYLLSVKLDGTIERLALRRDGTATIERVILLADYRLTGNEDEVLLADTARAATTYDIIDEHFAAIVARRDAEQRAVRLLAEEIATKLAIFMARLREAEPL